MGKKGLKKQLLEVEKKIIKETYVRNKRNKPLTLKELNISRKTLLKKLRLYKMK